MGTLLQDIQSQSSWLIKAFKADGFKLNYSIDSFKVLDRFYDLHVKEGTPVPGGRFAEHYGPIMFSIGAYMGETFIRVVPGTTWRTDDSNSEGEFNATIVFPDGGEVWPMQRALKRFDSAENGLYAYGRLAVPQQTTHTPAKKPWWKLW